MGWWHPPSARPLPRRLPRQIPIWAARINIGCRWTKIIGEIERLDYGLYMWCIVWEYASLCVCIHYSGEAKRFNLAILGLALRCWHGVCVRERGQTPAFCFNGRVCILSRLSGEFRIYSKLKRGCVRLFRSSLASRIGSWALEWDSSAQLVYCI